MKAKVTINVCGIKVREYETEITKMPDIRGFAEEMRRLKIPVKVGGSTKLEATNGK